MRATYFSRENFHQHICRAPNTTSPHVCPIHFFHAPRPAYARCLYRIVPSIITTSNIHYLRFTDTTIIRYVTKRSDTYRRLTSNIEAARARRGKKKREEKRRKERREKKGKRRKERGLIEIWRYGQRYKWLRIHWTHYRQLRMHSEWV